MFIKMNKYTIWMKFRNSQNGLWCPFFYILIKIYTLSGSFNKLIILGKAYWTNGAKVYSYGPSSIAL